jgi:hypothetical protein
MQFSNADMQSPHPPRRPQITISAGSRTCKRIEYEWGAIPIPLGENDSRERDFVDWIGFTIPGLADKEKEEEAGH